jgi:heptose I phosphotransferase
MTLYLRDEYATAWKHRDVFMEVERLEGKVYRELDGRRTLQFTFDRKSYFLKLHRGIGWGEIFKNLIQLRLPVISAKNEWRAVDALHKIDVDTMTIAAFGERGWNPAKRHSFIITDDLADTTSLEDICAEWPKQPPTYKVKKRLIEKVATMAKRMHGAGINHRDFYICHFLLPNSVDVETQSDFPLHLIDLHRAQMRAQVPARWLLKDLAALYFSVMEIGLSQRDLLRFLYVYSGGDIKRWIQTNRSVWKGLQRKADKLYKRKQRYGDAI